VSRQVVGKTLNAECRVPKCNRYFFEGVCGYNGMPVLCFCEADNIGWVAYGGVLDARGKHVLAITPGADLECDTTRANGSLPLARPSSQP